MSSRWRNWTQVANIPFAVWNTSFLFSWLLKRKSLCLHLTLTGKPACFDAIYRALLINLLRSHSDICFFSKPVQYPWVSASDCPFSSLRISLPDAENCHSLSSDGHNTVLKMPSCFKIITTKKKPKHFQNSRSDTSGGNSPLLLLSLHLYLPRNCFGVINRDALAEVTLIWPVQSLLLPLGKGESSLAHIKNFSFTSTQSPVTFCWHLVKESSPVMSPQLGKGQNLSVPELSSLPGIHQKTITLAMYWRAHY